MGEKELLFDAIYKEHHAKVFRLCKGYFAADEALAKDATQEVFIKVWEHLKNFRGDASVSTWIYRISVNTCLLFLRKKKNRKENIMTNITDAADKEYDNDQERKLKLLYKSLATLDESSRVIILMVLEGVSYEEIAKVIGITEDTLRVRIHRIKNKLSKKISHERV
ncbi:RNA polymerase sigma factor [Sungkyunkwania multivorans]|uniref:RNA polymerase sigma factor n=1 Tax=Sungkyunkwania multivorans TaxID=1173618 RepID=A0ABW3CWA6_9FLAO